MGYLLNIMLALLALGLADVGWESSREWPVMLLVVGMLPHGLGRLARRQVLRGRFQSAEHLLRLLALSPPIFFAILVGVFGWSACVERWTGGTTSLLAWPEPALLVVLLPYCALQLLAIDARSRALWVPTTGRRWRAFQVRMFLAGLGPIALYLTASIAIGTMPAVRTRLEIVSIYQALFAGALLVCFGLAMPFFLSRTWDTEPIPHGERRVALESIAALAGFKARKLLVWNTGGTTANAAIVGVGPRTRVVLFSDMLLAQLDPRELGAVFAHEIGHAVHRHVFVFLAFAGGTFLGIDWVANVLLGDHEWFAGAFVLSSLAASYWTFGWLSRRFELEADLYSLALLRDPRALITALEKVGGGLRDAGSWRHFSTARRIEFLVRASLDTRVGEKLQRVLRVARVASAALFLITSGLQAWSLATRTPAEFVRLDLCLGRYAEAHERASKQEGLERGLAALADRGHELRSMEASLDELRRRARTAMADGDARAAHEWLLLAALRGADECAEVAEAVRVLSTDPEAFEWGTFGEAKSAAWKADLEALRRRASRMEPVTER